MTRVKILGGPGCHKTSTLVSTPSQYLDDGTIDSIAEVCACTFRREMQEALESQLEERYGCESEEMINVGTVHGICRRLAGIRCEDILEAADLRKFAASFDLEYSLDKAYPDPVDSSIDPVDMSMVKKGNVFFDLYNWLQNTEKGIDDIPDYPNYWRLDRGIDPASFIEEYEEFKRKIGKYDFNDMLNEVLERKLFPEVGLLLWDEFHDVTPKQYTIFRLWAKNIKHVYIAADPYQCIYSFWGATPDFFELFKAELITLRESTRFGPTVWNRSKEILEVAGYEHLPDIEPMGESNEVETLDREQYLEKVLPNYTSDTFHLVRCHYMAYPIAKALMDAGIPFSGDYGWSGWHALVYNGVFYAKQRGKVYRDELKALIDIHPEEFFAEDRDKLKEKIEKSPKPVYTLNEIKSWLPPLSLHADANFISSLTDEIPLKHAEIGESTKKKIVTALERLNMPITRITLYLGTIHSVKGWEAGNVFVWDEINRKIDRACYDAEGSKAEGRVWFVATSRVKRNLFWVDSERRYRYGG